MAVQIRTLHRGKILQKFEVRSEVSWVVSCYRYFFCSLSATLFMLPCLGVNELCHLSLKTSTTLKTPLAFAMSWSSRVGLKNKTKVPSLVGYRTLPNCIIGENVERIDQFVSLGSFHSTHGGIELDVIR